MRKQIPDKTVASRYVLEGGFVLIYQNIGRIIVHNF